MIAVVFAATTLSACGGSEPEATPAACLGGADAYLQALEADPTGATLDGTPISDCLIKEQTAADVSTVGSALIETATRLEGEADRDPGGDATVALGYLVGSVDEASADTAGIHTALVRRIDSTVRASGRGGAADEFQAAFDEGYEAARAAG
jgi:hypothetical protein